MQANPIDIVRNAWAAFATRDESRIEAVFTPDARWIPPPGNATAVAVGHGDLAELDRAAIVRFMAREFPKLFVSHVQSTPRSAICQGNTVVMETTFKATVVNGRSYENDYCFVIEVKEGRIHRMREYMDTHRGFAAMFGDAEPSTLI